MKFKIFLVLLFASNTHLFSQKIDQTLPEGITNYIDQAQYHRLLSLTLEQLEEFDVLEVNEGQIKVQLSEQPYTFSMLSLIQQCAELEPAAKEEFIREYFHTFINAYYDQIALASADFSTVKQYLTLRLYPKEFFQESERDKWVIRTDLDGTVTCAMLNLPTAFATVKREQLEQWGVDDTEVFHWAQENAKKRSYEVHHKQLDDSTELVAIAGGDYTSGAAFRLEEVIPESISRYGAIVAIPHQNMILLHNLKEDEHLSYKTFIEYTYMFVLEQYQQHKAPVSPDFYWYYQGKFTRILMGEDTEGQLQIVPPVALNQFSEE
uniref:Uncharacterized protein n=1 Tax=Roseihalotalea indica TaxID=2867963 RepID=A0AA49GT91_9BACT|nr:hypothetical protein K4G66_11515 [Tunicatimonas sp. TK19036]